MSSNGFPFWSEDWAKAQQKYWEAWTSLGKAAAPGTRTPPGDFWGDALGQWWKAVAPAAPDPVQEFYDHLVKQGRSYLELTEELRRGLMEAASAGPGAQDWQQAVDKALEGMRGFLGQRPAQHQGKQAGEAMMRDMLAAWELPMDTWQRTASVMSGLPGDLLEGGKWSMPGGQDQAVREHFERFLSVPGLGYTREHQEQYQRMGRVLLDYQGAMQEYGEQYARIANKALERLRDRLLALADAEDRPSRLRDLYDLWVDASEEAYAEVVAGEDYARVYGRLVNSLMAVKHEGRRMADEAAGSLGLPTRQEMDCIEARMQELRREVRALRGARRGEPSPAGEDTTPAMPPAPPPRGPVAGAPRKRAAAKKKRTSAPRTSNKGASE